MPSALRNLISFAENPLLEGSSEESRSGPRSKRRGGAAIREHEHMQKDQRIPVEVKPFGQRRLQPHPRLIWCTGGSHGQFTSETGGLLGEQLCRRLGPERDLHRKQSSLEETTQPNRHQSESDSLSDTASSLFTILRRILTCDRHAATNSCGCQWLVRVEHIGVAAIVTTWFPGDSRGGRCSGSSKLPMGPLRFCP